MVSYTLREFQLFYDSGHFGARFWIIILGHFECLELTHSLEPPFLSQPRRKPKKTANSAVSSRLMVPGQKFFRPSERTLHFFPSGSPPPSPLSSHLSRIVETLQ